MRIRYLSSDVCSSDLLTTPGEHDRDMVYSLAFTHTIARVIDGMNIPDIKLTTKNYEAMQREAELSVKDTDQLYYDMLYCNPYLATLAEQVIADRKNVVTGKCQAEGENVGGPRE